MRLLGLGFVKIGILLAEESINIIINPEPIYFFTRFIHNGYIMMIRCPVNTTVMFHKNSLLLHSEITSSPLPFPSIVPIRKAYY